VTRWLGEVRIVMNKVRVMVAQPRGMTIRSRRCAVAWMAVQWKM
jgi:hypothetical protein